MYNFDGFWCYIHNILLLLLLLYLKSSGGDKAWALDGEAWALDEGGMGVGGRCEEGEMGDNPIFIMRKGNAGWILFCKISGRTA